MTLDKLPIGRRAIITQVCCPEHDLRARLLAMGLVQGNEIEVAHIAPLGDPITIRLLAGHVALRKSEAAFISVSTI